MLFKISTWSEWKHDMNFNFWIKCTTWLISMNILFDFWMICITWLVTPRLHQPNRTHCLSKLTSKIQPTTLDQFFYQVLIQSTINKKNKYNSNDDNGDNHVQDALASTQHHLLVPKGMKRTPRYQVDYAYTRWMLIMHKPWNKHNAMEHN